MQITLAGVQTVAAPGTERVPIRSLQQSKRINYILIKEKAVAKLYRLRKRGDQCSLYSNTIRSGAKTRSQTNLKTK